MISGENAANDVDAILCADLMNDFTSPKADATLKNVISEHTRFDHAKAISSEDGGLKPVLWIIKCKFSFAASLHFGSKISLRLSWRDLIKPIMAAPDYLSIVNLTPKGQLSELRRRA